MMMMMMAALAFSSAILSYASFLWSQAMIHFLICARICCYQCDVSRGNYSSDLLLPLLAARRSHSPSTRASAVALLRLPRFLKVSSSDHATAGPPHQQRWHPASCLDMKLWSSASAGVTEGNGIIIIIIITMWLSIVSFSSAGWCNQRVLITVETVGVNRAQTWPSRWTDNRREPSPWIWSSAQPVNETLFCDQWLQQLMLLIIQARKSQREHENKPNFYFFFFFFGSKLSVSKWGA